MHSPEPIAHTAEDGRCQLLYDHLMGTAKLAAVMAGEFECSGWGEVEGER